MEGRQQELREAQNRLAEARVAALKQEAEVCEIGNWKIKQEAEVCSQTNKMKIGIQIGSSNRKPRFVLQQKNENRKSENQTGSRGLKAFEMGENRRPRFIIQQNENRKLENQKGGRGLKAFEKKSQTGGRGLFSNKQKQTKEK